MTISIHLLQTLNGSFPSFQKVFIEEKLHRMMEHTGYSRIPSITPHIFVKILCLLMNRLIYLRDNTNITTLFSLSCPLFCDIVTFHNLTSPDPRDFFVKNGKIIKLFRSLQEKYKDDLSCSNSYLYYIFSIFCKHSYIGETKDIFRRVLEKIPTSFLYSVLHSIGIENFTFLHTLFPHSFVNL